MLRVVNRYGFPLFFYYIYMKKLSSMAQICVDREKEILGEDASPELTHAFRQGFIAALEADKVMYDMIMKMGLTKPKNIES
jgi:hypothetical protein